MRDKTDHGDLNGMELKTLNEELNEMAEKVLNKQDTKTRLKSFSKRFFSSVDPITVIVIAVVVSVLSAVAIPSVYIYRRNQAMVSVVVLPADQKLDYKNKHWANVLILIHERDVQRTAEIIKEADKPYRLMEVRSYENGYENRIYLVTRELEELLKTKGVRYQRKQYDDIERLYSINEYAGANVRLYVEITPWINW